ncbi:MAG TPA: CARDB domain-containing protein, partial [Candidatus Thermoplasmatota archaeon]|nr:CARDB domain-containing protein [Candidatus Thermoplasmatota archaeon]
RRHRAVLATATLLLGGLLLLSLAPHAEAQTTQSGSDLKATLSEVPSKIVADQTRQIRVTISNVGDTTTLGGYQILLKSIGPKHDINLPLDQRESKTNPHRVFTPLGAGASESFTFLWNASVEQNGTASIQAIVSPLGATRDVNSGNDRASAVTFVHVPQPKVIPTWTITTERAAAPGGDIPLRFTVKNEGNDVDTLALGMVGEATLRGKGWTWEFPTSEFVLDPGQSVEALARLIPTQATTAGETVDGEIERVQLLAKSKANPTFTHSFPIPRVTARQSYGVNLTGPTDVVILTPAAPLNLPFKLENGGTGTDTIQLRIEGAPDNDTWVRSFPDGGNVTLPRKTTRDITIGLTAPFTFPTGPLQFWVVAESVNGPAETRQLVRVNVRQVYLLHAQAMDPERTTPAGETVSFRLNLTNKGNGDDTFSLSLLEDEQRFRIPAGWGVTFEDPAPVVPGNTTRFVYLNATVPPGTAANTVANLKVRVVSLGSTIGVSESQANQTILTMRATVLAGPRARLLFDPAPNAFVEKDGELRYPLRILSVGNEPGTFRLEATRTTPAGRAVWDLPTFTNSTLSNLAVGSEGQSAVIVRPPFEARVGDEAEVTVTLKGPNGATYAVKRFKATVAGPDLNLSALRVEPPGIVYAGDQLQLSASLTNRGTEPAPGPLEVRFYRSQGSERVPVGAAKLPDGLAAGRGAVVRVPLDTSALRDAYLIEAVVDEDEKVEELSESNNLVSLTTNVRRYAVNVQGPRNQTAVPGESVTFGADPYAVVLRNDGNTEETLTVRILSEHGWIPAGETTQIVRLAPGERRTLNFSVRVPAEPGAPKDRLDITVENGLRPDFRTRLVSGVEVRDETPPRFFEPKVDNPVIAIKDSINLTVRVRDAIQVDRVIARLEYPNKGLFDRTMVNVGGDRWRLTTGFDVVGSFNVTFIATDQAGNAQEARGPGFRVVAGSKPDIRFLGDNRSLITAGFPIPLIIEDPLGVKSVDLILDGNTRNKTALTAPYVIDTSRFPQGERKIEVRAKNLYDETTSFSFKVTVDNTPPKVKTLTWTEPIPGLPLTVTAVLEDKDLATVNAVLLLNGQKQEVPMEDKGGGKYVATFTPSEGTYRISVNATDKAGNLATQGTDAEIVVEDGSLLARLTPGTAWAGTLAALGAAAVVSAGRSRRPGQKP